MAPSGSVRMGYLMIFVCFVLFERGLTVTPSDSTIGDDQRLMKPNRTTTPEGTDISSFDASTGENSRTSRALPNLERSDGDSMEDKRSSGAMIPNIRFGRSGESMIPTLRFGRSGESMIPTLRFGRSGESMIPTLRFGRSGESMIPTLRFGRSGESMIPTLRFGRSGESMIPTLRFGRSGNSMIPSIRFGRSGNSMIPSIRFGRSGNSMIPSIRFGRSGDSMIPMLRFGRSNKNFNEELSESDVFGNDIEDESREDDSLINDNVSYIDDNEESYNDFSDANTDTSSRQSAQKRRINEYGSVIPYPRFGREVGTDSKEAIKSLEFLNRILKRQTNDSIIPQIRYGRSFLKEKETEELKPNYFILPNIRPGRSSPDGLNIEEVTSDPYYADLDGFLGLFGAFRRSDGDSIEESIDTQEMELGTQFDEMLVETDQANTDPSDKELEEELVKSNKDYMHVIPYPRPGKRQFGKQQTSQKGNVEYQGTDPSHLTQTNKVSTYMLPYPRPGKRSRRNVESVEYARSKRSNIPYPRPGRSNSVLPYPKLGRSNSILPYPRLGRSSSVLPYPRPGRSNSILPYPRLGRSTAILPYPRPGRSSIVLPYPRPGRSSKEGNYMLPYPRPGRSQQSFLYESKNADESPIEELKRSKRSAEHYELDLLNPMSIENVESKHSGSGQISSFQGENSSDDLINILLRKIKDSEADSKHSYVLPYPRPGRDV